MPERTCVGCRGKTEQSELIRVVYQDGRYVLDSTGTLPGRGAYVHAECVDVAVKRRAFQRALKQSPASSDGLEVVIAGVSPRG